MKEEILNFVNNKYKGSLRFLKPKMFIDNFGEKKYQNVLNETIFLKSDVAFSERIYCILNDIKKHPTCLTCQNEVVYGIGFKSGYPKYCSNECRFKDSNTIKEKIKKTNIERYGSTNFLASIKGKEIIKKTNLEKYGVENYTQTKEYKERLKSGDIKRNTNTEKVIQTYRTKYYNLLKSKYSLFEPLFSEEEYQGAASYDVLYKWKCKICDTKFERWLNNNYPLECPTCKPKGTYFENVIKSFFERYNIKYIFRDRSQLPRKIRFNIKQPY